MKNYSQPTLFDPQPTYTPFVVPRPKKIVIHQQESRKESEVILKSQEKRLSNNCKQIFDYLMVPGNVLNSVTASQMFGIVDFRRRCCDLIENEIQLSGKPSTLGKGIKDRFMTPSQIYFNKRLGF